MAESQSQESSKQLEQFVRIIRKHELRDGDILLIDPRSGLNPQDLVDQPWAPGMPRVNVMFVLDVNAVQHIPLGWKPPGKQPGRVGSGS